MKTLEHKPDVKQIVHFHYTVNRSYDLCFFPQKQTGYDDESYSISLINISVGEKHFSNSGYRKPQSVCVPLQLVHDEAIIWALAIHVPLDLQRYKNTVVLVGYPVFIQASGLNLDYLDSSLVKVIFFLADVY